MNVLIFGASGMGGQGVLRECLRATDVDRVLTVDHADAGVQYPNVLSLVLPDLMNYPDVESELQGLTPASSVLACPPPASTKRSTRALPAT